MTPATANILIVDDDGTVRASLGRLLEHEGHRVAVASSGVAAVHALTKGEFELVMLDLRMPQLGGMTVLQYLRSQHPRIPVVVMTGFPSIENAKEAIRLGAFDFLLKPLDPVATLTVVANALASSSWTAKPKTQLR